MSCRKCIGWMCISSTGWKTLQAGCNCSPHLLLRFQPSLRIMTTLKLPLPKWEWGPTPCWQETPTSVEKGRQGEAGCGAATELLHPANITLLQNWNLNLAVISESLLKDMISAADKEQNCAYLVDGNSVQVFFFLPPVREEAGTNSMHSPQLKVNRRHPDALCVSLRFGCLKCSFLTGTSDCFKILTFCAFLFLSQQKQLVGVNTCC